MNGMTKRQIDLLLDFQNGALPEQREVRQGAMRTGWCPECTNGRGTVKKDSETGLALECFVCGNRRMVRIGRNGAVQALA